MADDPMNVDQNGHAEGDDNQNVQEEGVDIELPRFRVVRVHSFLNPVRAYRVPIDGIDGGDPIPVLDKDLRWKEAIPVYNLLSVDEDDDAEDLLNTLTEEEWQRASPAQNVADFVKVFATGPDHVEYELHLRHGVSEDELALEYDLTHEWGRVVTNYGLLAGDIVRGDGYRDVENDQLRLELRFIRDGDEDEEEERDNLISGPQSENQEEGEGEGNVIESSSANGGSAAAAAVAVSRERNQAPPPAARTARVQLPRFLNPQQPAKTHSVTTDPDGGGGAVLVLEKDLGLTDADADHNLLSVSEADGAGTPLRALTDGEWRKASPTNVEDFVKVLATGPNDDEYELRPRHRVLENEPPEYDLTHGWSRAVSDFGLKAGNRDIKDNPNVQEENQEDGEGEGEEEEEEEGEGEGKGGVVQQQQLHED